MITSISPFVMSSASVIIEFDVRRDVLIARVTGKVNVLCSSLSRYVYKRQTGTSETSKSRSDIDSHINYRFLNTPERLRVCTS